VDFYDWQSPAGVRADVTNYNEIKDLPMKLQIPIVIFLAFIVAFPDEIVALCQQTHEEHRYPSAEPSAKGSELAHATQSKLGF